MTKSNRHNRYPYSIKRSIKKIFYIAIPVIIVNLMVSLFSILIIKQQNIDYISNTITLYQNETLAKIKAVEHFISWSVVNEPLIKTIETTDDYYEKINTISTFRTRVNDSQYTTGKDYQYFINLYDQNLFLNCSSLQLSYSDYLICKDYFLNLINQNQIKKSNSTWNTLKIKDTYYLYYSITYYNRTFISLISAQDLLKPLDDINLGIDGFISMIDSEGTPLTNFTKMDNPKIHKSNSLFLNHLVFDKTNSMLPFTLEIYLDNFGNFEKIIFIQLIVIITAFIIAIIMFIFLFYMHNKVIKPIHQFSKNLLNINENTNLLDLQSSNIIELEQANVQFKNLMHEIKKLKISIYEQELDKKRIQIDFMQHQIRPHFYLNCLTTIYSMAQLEQYKEIASMALSTSKYLRYLFQTNKDFVQLEYELNHIKDYLNIQTLRYGSTFSYTYNIEQELIHGRIPPLILMTFIENTIKHCMFLEESLEISLSVMKKIENQQDYLYIAIKDTGPGFSADILELLNTKQVLNKEDGSCIGISNAIQRLSLLYSNNYELYFSNGTDRGAKIELIVPYII